MILSRRAALRAGLAVAAGIAFPSSAGIAGPRRDLVLRPVPAKIPLVGPNGPRTAVWGYNGGVPGPEIRLPQGARLRVVVDNGLDQDTTVHWHGLRIPHAMDGVPVLTQPPIVPGKRFVYEFVVPDAGTYWYHPHVRGSEQQGRGLYGALVVDEKDPPRVDRDITWVIDDWRLTPDAAISEPFGRMMDLTHGGRLGNTVSLNGRLATTFGVRAGERLRLRLISTANARIFALRFDGHAPRVIALDGQPVTPHDAPGGRVILPPAGRADLILDAAGEPGRRYAVIDEASPRRAYRYLELVYSPEAPLRASPLDAPVALAANPIPEPDLANARRHDILLGGGAMGGMAGATLDGRALDIRQLARRGKVWALNGIVAHKTAMDPLIAFKRGETQVLAIANQTAFPHPMHLHGHSFRLITRNGRPAPHRPWLDTVLLAPRETVEVAFVADNPGDWLFHCHVLEHMEAGMSAVLRVA
jgi:FtsP/CotA-like multicopper oxidase with cupredoxin domain